LRKGFQLILVKCKSGLVCFFVVIYLFFFSLILNAEDPPPENKTWGYFSHWIRVMLLRDDYTVENKANILVFLTCCVLPKHMEHMVLLHNTVLNFNNHNEIVLQMCCKSFIIQHQIELERYTTERE
jgi:hypothetical protein